MEYNIVAYRSRAVTSKAYNFLVSNGVSCALISTPKEAYVGCGLSIKFSPTDLMRVQELLGYNAPTFAGYFRAFTKEGKNLVVRID